MSINESGFIAALGAAPVIAVVTVADVDSAEPLARALARAGVRVVEVTLRTAAALAVIRRMKHAAADLLIGAGTVLDAGAARASIDAGADFKVSPGSTPALRRALRNSGGAAIPGVATISEAMACREAGFTVLKWFPAAAAGGPRWLEAAAAPLPDLRFIPSGGVTADNARAYLALANVIGVGGSWIAAPEDLRRRAWTNIEAKARAAVTKSGINEPLGCGFV
jgi:2-dehydro-3-deoxyphosphogluconate aldolase/(4S)-4-hydroxy-2-oxoglutarate aldolase